MDFAAALLQLFGLATRWAERMRGFALLLALPLIIVTIAAFITPPDIFSQIALSVPLYLLYEISLLLCKYMEKKKAETDA